jgi:hypothetical protein
MGCGAVAGLGWLGLAGIGVLIALIATRAELGEAQPHLYLSGAAPETGRGPPEQRDAGQSAGSDFARWAAAARAVGIACAVVGAVMFVRHQL